MAKADITTNIRPKFTWLFLGKPMREDFTGAPVTLRTEADDEQAARDAFPDWSLTFAAKIRTDCPVTCSWMERDYLWTVIGSDARKSFDSYDEIAQSHNKRNGWEASYD